MKKRKLKEEQNKKKIEAERDGMGNISKWKESLLESSVLRQSANLMQLVYGKSTSTSANFSKEVQDSSEGEESDDDEFFKPKGEGNKNLREGLDSGNVNTDDCSKFKSYDDLKSWKEEEVYESISDRFVSGDWSKAAGRNKVSKANSKDDDSDEAVYGDFEDLETGEKHEGHQIDNSGGDAINNEDESAFEERRLKKLGLRAKFDAQYNLSELQEEEMDEKDGAKFHRGQPNEIGLVDKMEEEIELRKQINIAELNDLDDVTQLEIDGFRKGTYLRLEILDVPFEMVEYFDSCHPVLERGIGLGEENVGYMQARLKRHRWHEKVLETRDPIIVSIGWRRFQTIPVYARGPYWAVSHAEVHSRTHALPCHVSFSITANSNVLEFNHEA